MKQTIRTAAVFTAIVLTTFQFTHAQEPVKKFRTIESKITMASKNLLVSFQKGNDGVIESALRFAAEIKMQYASSDLRNVIRAMDGVLKNHKNGSIRYKAYVAISVCENPDWYSAMTTSNNETNEDFFLKASSMMNERLISSAE